MPKHFLPVMLSLVVIPCYTLGLIYTLAYYPKACDPSQMYAYVSGSNMLLMGLIPTPLVTSLLIVVFYCRQHSAQHCQFCAATPLWYLALPNFVVSLALQTLASVELSRSGCLAGPSHSDGILGCLVGEWVLSALVLGTAVLMHYQQRAGYMQHHYQEI